MPLTRRQSREREEEEWIICSSKSRPGKQYLFNKNTGETKWSPEAARSPKRSPKRSRGGAGDEGENERAAAGNEATPLLAETPTSTPPPKLTKALREPANDRLKRLQTTLKRDRKEKIPNKHSANITKSTPSSKSLAVKAERPSTSGIHIKESPSKPWAAPASTEAETRSTTAEPLPTDALTATKTPVLIERPIQIATGSAASQQGRLGSFDSHEPNKSPTSRSPKNWTRKRRGRPPLRSSPKAKTKRVSTLSITTDENVTEVLEQSTINTFSFSAATPAAAPTHSGNGFVNKVCELFKNTYKNAINRTTFKIPKKSSADLPSKPAGSVVVQQALNELRAAQQRRNDEMPATSSSAAKTTPPRNVELSKTFQLTTPSPRNVELPKTIQMTTPPSLSNTPKNLVIPRYEIGSANSRLASLRKSLLQQPSGSAKSATTPYATPAPSVGPSTSSRNESPQNSVYQSASSSTNDEIEPMDWQPIDEVRRETIEISDSHTTLGGLSVKREHTADSTVSEYYDMVNENLMRYDAEKQLSTHASPRKWRKDHYYFVIDTNVMLQNLTFIDDLSKMKLCDTNGTILYIPYTVLQELDKLKMRAASESVKLQTGRAIKYLNLKFESKNKNIQAQSAMDERVRLIDITSPDDSIINCCLQVQKHVDHIILLTEDVNLRNKAICNNLLVSTKSDLVSKHPDSGGVSPK